VDEATSPTAHPALNFGPLGTRHIEEGGNYLIDSTPEYLSSMRA